MNIFRLTAPPAVPCPHLFSVLNRIFAVGIFLALLLTVCVAQAEGPDDDYLAIYGIIDRADALSASGQTSQAHAKYLEAQRALAAFQRNNATFNPKMVSYRLNFLAQKIAATSDQTATTQKSSGSASVGSKQATAQVAAKSPVKLLNAGSEPRTVLRLHPPADDKQTMNMTIKMGMVMSAAGKTMPAMDVPEMLMTMDVAVKNVSDNGDITYEMQVSDVDVVTNANSTAAMATATKSSLAKMRGISGVGKISDHGIIKAVEMKRPDDADPQLNQMLEQMKDSFSSSSLPLPEEAVGAGAKWEYKTKIKSQGMTIEQTTGCELIALEGDRLTLRSTLTQSAANQKFESPAMPGMKMDLNKLTGTGTGDTTVDLTHIMPAMGTMDQKTAISLGMNMGQQKQTMDMKIDMRIKLESK